MFSPCFLVSLDPGALLAAAGDDPDDIGHWAVVFAVSRLWLYSLIMIELLIASVIRTLCDN